MRRLIYTQCIWLTGTNDNVLSKHFTNDHGFQKIPKIQKFQLECKWAETKFL